MSLSVVNSRRGGGSFYILCNDLRKVRNREGIIRTKTSLERPMRHRNNGQPVRQIVTTNLLKISRRVGLFKDPITGPS